jgi:hypothetical protein
MAQQLIAIGAAPNDGTGDFIRDAYDKCNDNFTELYGDRAIDLTASAAFAGGEFCNIHASGGAAKIRKADATDDTKPVNGFVPAAILSGATGTMIAPGARLTGLSGLAPGSTYYLDASPGAITVTPPAAAGNLVQEVGVALSATDLLFNPKPGVTL